MLGIEVARGRLLVAGAGAAALLAGAAFAFFALRDSGSSKPNAPAATPDTASPLAARLITAETVAGNGWRTVSETTLTSISAAPQAFVPAAPDVPECFPIREFEAALIAQDRAFESGFSRLIGTGGPGGDLGRITHLAAVFADVSAAEAAVQAANTALGGPGFVACIRAAAARGGMDVAAEELAPIDVPNGGVSRLVRYRPTTPAGAEPVTQAIAWWAEDDSLFVLTMSIFGETLSEAEIRDAAAAAIRAGAGP